ncbi:MAG: MarR family transcriptional regulator [Lachnospiraceae bacterium]|nr:MarR family transcriptional regulator [Lachnospiraceae bacterium]
MEIQNCEQTASDFCFLLLKIYDIFLEYPVDTGKYRIDSNAFRALCCISRCKESQISLTELTDRMHIAKQQLTRLVNDLEEAGLVERRRYTSNRRVVYLALSENGREYLDTVKQSVQCSINKGIAQEEPERLELLARAAAMMREALQKKGE